MIRILFSLLILHTAAACQTPGYDYQARIAPNFPEAADYRAVIVEPFRGPGGETAGETFNAMVDEAQIDGQFWFLDPRDGYDGAYSGQVDVVGYEAEERYDSSKECVEYDGLLDCEHRAYVERFCVEESVDVTVTTTLTDIRDGSTVFTHSQDGHATREECEKTAEFHADSDYDGEYRDVVRRSLNVYNAPIGMIADAAREAVRRFRQDIAPYNKTVRAEIMKDALMPEVALDTRFGLAVEATKRGEPMGACAQWDELLKVYPRAPSILHNSGACAEARGDMQTAQERYARAAEITKSIPLVKDKMTKSIFTALERVSGQRHNDLLIDNAAPPMTVETMPES